MKKVKVYVEEHLCREIEIEVPDDMNVDERMEYAEQCVWNAYYKGEIVLDANDFTGTALCSVMDEETGNATDWHDL